MASALQSLIQILEQTLLPQHQSWIIQPDQKPQIESLLGKAISMKALLERSSVLSSSNKFESLESQIRDVAYRAEDVIESYTTGLSSTLSSQDLQKAIDEFHSATAEVVKIADGNRNEEEETSLIVPPLRPDPSPKQLLVGIDDDLIQLKDRLTVRQEKQEIIPILGMGGLGKTTLARKVYDDPYIMSHFDACAWVTLSQEYNFRVVLQGLLRCIIHNERIIDELLHKENNILAERLYQNLFGSTTRKS